VTKRRVSRVPISRIAGTTAPSAGSANPGGVGGIVSGVASSLNPLGLIPTPGSIVGGWVGDVFKGLRPILKIGAGGVIMLVTGGALVYVAGRNTGAVQATRLVARAVPGGRTVLKASPKGSGRAPAGSSAQRAPGRPDLAREREDTRRARADTARSNADAARAKARSARDQAVVDRAYAKEAQSARRTRVVTRPGIGNKTPTRPRRTREES
jgi:hypothetical protein